MSRREKEDLTKAAELSNTTVSNSVLQKAYAKAPAVPAEQNRFRLPESQWQAFCDALDGPSKNIAELQTLLTEPGVFDG